MKENNNNRKMKQINNTNGKNPLQSLTKYISYNITSSVLILDSSPLVPLIINLFTQTFAFGFSIPITGIPIIDSFFPLDAPHFKIGEIQG